MVHSSFSVFSQITAFQQIQTVLLTAFNFSLSITTYNFIAPAQMPILVENLKLVAEKYGEKVLETSKGNNISIAVTCNGIANPTELGSWLFKRSVSGTRVVAPGK